MGTGILIFLAICLTCALAAAGVVFFNNAAQKKLNEASEDITNMLLDTQYVIVVFKPYSRDNEYCEYGIFTAKEIQSQGIRTSGKFLTFQAADYKNVLTGRLMPRPFLSRLQRVKLGSYTLEQLYNDCRDNDKKILIKKTI